LKNSTKTFTIGIDARLSGKKHAGIGRYIENLLIELLKTDQPNIKWVFFFHHQQQATPILNKTKSHSNLKIIYVPIRHYSFLEQTKLPKIINSEKLDLLHVPHFNISLLNKVPIVVTIHDLLWHQQIGPEVTTLPPWKYYLKYIAYRLVTTQALLKAKKIFVPTNSVKKDLLTLNSSLKNKIVVTPEGISESFEKQHQCLQNSSRLPQNNKGNLLIYVGSLYPHKNIEVVFQALAKLKDYKLKIVCARNVFVERTRKRVSELNLYNQVEFTGYLSDDELVTAIQSSLALIQPSKSEGFGLTAIEAMAVGTPVIASNLPVFKEIYQQAPLFFNPDNPDELAKLIKKLKDLKTYQHHQAFGLKTAELYNWSKMAKNTIDTYLSVISNV